MRIILKPAGAAMIIAAFGVLVFLLIHRSGAHPSDAASAAATTTASAGQPTPVASPPPPSTLQNSGFESDYGPITPYDTKATLSGTTAASWHDDSSWAKVDVAYAKDTTDPHSGAACQQIEVKAVHRELDPTSAVQFVQPVSLTPNKPYEAAIWLRAEKPLSVEFSLRQAQWPFKYYGSKTVTVGPKWQEARVSGTIGSDGVTFVLLKTWKPGKLWVDDASVTAK